MKIVKIYVGEEDNGRIDAFLAKELDEFSRTYIQKLIINRLVEVNGKSVKPRYLVKEGDYITVKLSKPKEIEIVPENIPLDLVYEDEDIGIINKPKGMVVHPAPGNYSKTLVNALLFHMDSLSSINGVIRPGIVHRIDKDTSGLLVVAKSDFAHIFLADELKKHNISRVYIALVHGDLKKDKGTIDAPIGRNPRNRKRMTVTDINSKEAITHYEIIERFGNYSLIRAKLETGRTHQIRVHMAYINHPVVGDPFYSNIKCKFKTNGQLLHAKKIGLFHPRSKEYMEFESDLPDCFSNVINILRKRGD